MKTASYIKIFFFLFFVFGLYIVFLQKDKDLINESKTNVVENNETLKKDFQHERSEKTIVINNVENKKKQTSKKTEFTYTESDQNSINNDLPATIEEQTYNPNEWIVDEMEIIKDQLPPIQNEWIVDEMNNMVGKSIPKNNEQIIETMQEMTNQSTITQNEQIVNDMNEMTTKIPIENEWLVDDMQEMIK